MHVLRHHETKSQGLKQTAWIWLNLSSPTNTTYQRFRTQPAIVPQDSCSRPKALVSATKIDFIQAIEANESSARRRVSGSFVAALAVKVLRFNDVMHHSRIIFNTILSLVTDRLIGLYSNEIYLEPTWNAFCACVLGVCWGYILQGFNLRRRFDLGELYELPRAMALRLCYCASFNRDGQVQCQ